LYTFLEKRPFSLTTDEILSEISQCLEGLATLSEKGIHGDLSSRILLLKRGGKEKVEAVISDFGAFRLYGKEERGLTAFFFGLPEYFAEKMISSKLDVWSMGISLYEIFSKQWLTLWKFYKKG
jgi:serine/threonine protein kinase